MRVSTPPEGIAGRRCDALFLQERGLACMVGDHQRQVKVVTSAFSARIIGVTDEELSLPRVILPCSPAR